jgi:NitT/TauT family transport system substrate-binding protein
MIRLSRRYAVAAVAGAVLARPRGAEAQGLTTIDVAGVPEDSITPALYADHSGLFRKYGVDVRIQAQRSGPAIASGVAGGAYGIGKASVEPIIIAHTKNIPFVMVAAGGLYDAKAPIAEMLVKADSPIKTAAELNGKTIAVFGLTDIFTLADRLWIDRNGGDSSTVKLVELPVSEIAAAIESGRIDAGAINEPELAAAKGSKKLRVLGRPFDAVAQRFMYTAWFTTTDFVNAHRAAVEGFARAMREAAAFANKNPAQTVDILSSFTRIEPNVIRSMTRVVQGTTLDVGLIQPVIDASARYKAIPASFEAKELIL